MDTITAALDAELEALEADIQENPDPRVARLAHLRSVRTMYLQGSSEADTSDHVPRLTVRPRVRLRIRTGGRQPSPGRAAALKAAYDYLLDKTEPVRTSTLLEYLESMDIEVGGTVPANNLSAMLSNDSRFRSNGRSGWTLVNKEAAA
jgi:hypothetical protein